MSPKSHRPSIGRTRRQLLSGCGVALATSLSALTSGCLSGLPPLGDGQRYGRLDVPSADDPTYRKWLPAPSSIDSTVERYHFAVLQPSDPRPDAPELFVARQAHAKADIDYFGIGFANYNRLIDSSVGTVIEATFDRKSVTQTISETSYKRTGEYRGYEVFSRSDVPRRVAVGNDIIVWTSSYRHDYPALEVLIDAGEGERPRYHEESATFERLTTAAGGNPYLGVNTAVHDPTGRPVMLADAVRFDDNTAYQVVHYHYEEGRVPTKQALKEALKTENYRFADEADAFDVQIDGQLATVETQIPLRSNRSLKPRYELPQVTWGVSHNEDEESLTFRHESGDPVPANRLFYDIDRPSQPGKIDKRSLWTDRDTVETGAEATVDLSEYPNATGVNLVYSTSDIGFHVLFGSNLRGESDD